MNKNLTWAITTFLIVAMVCGTALWINHNSWTLRFEMDDNTKEAIESIEFDEINNKPSSINLWIPPSEDWSMITYTFEDGVERMFINGEEVGYFQERINRELYFGIWNRTMSDVNVALGEGVKDE